mgnify:CR=1 FL=1
MSEETPATPEVTPVATGADVPPDRLAISPRSPHFNQDVLMRGVGIRFKGVVRTNIEEYSISEGWIKVALGKMRANIDEVMRNLAAESFSELPVLARHAAAVASLPHHHRDPFDRLLVAQSRADSLRLMTSDKTVARYGEHVMLVG